jgi:succinyl-diaminopimelate desuccinylase
MVHENIQLRKKELLSAIERDRERLIGFLQAFARIDTANPPGDTRECVKFFCNFLEEQNLPYRIIAPQDKMPNILGSFEFRSPGRHLVLNGHIDVFPVGDINAWTRDPWGGEIVDGRVWGRGTVDMKCGTTASLFTYFYLHKVRENLKGKVTLTIVSD